MEHRYIACIFMGMPQKCQRICSRGRAITQAFIIRKTIPTWTKDKLQKILWWNPYDGIDLVCLGSRKQEIYYGADLTELVGITLSLRYTTMPYTGAAQKMKVYVKVNTIMVILETSSLMKWGTMLIR